MRRRPGSFATLVVLLLALGVATASLFVGEVATVVIGLLGLTVCVVVLRLTRRSSRVETGEVTARRDGTARSR